MRNATGHQGENERQRKSNKQEHIQHFLHETCNLDPVYMEWGIPV